MPEGRAACGRGWGEESMHDSKDSADARQIGHGTPRCDRIALRPHCAATGIALRPALCTVKREGSLRHTTRSEFDVQAN